MKMFKHVKCGWQHRFSKALTLDWCLFPAEKTGVRAVIL